MKVSFPTEQSSEKIANFVFKNVINYFGDTCEKAGCHLLAVQNNTAHVLYKMHFSADLRVREKMLGEKCEFCSNS